jgi:hypothetical protein
VTRLGSDLDVNEEDHHSLVEVVRIGRVDAQVGL